MLSGLVRGSPTNWLRWMVGGGRREDRGEMGGWRGWHPTRGGGYQGRGWEPPPAPSTPSQPPSRVSHKNFTVGITNHNPRIYIVRTEAHPTL